MSSVVHFISIAQALLLFLFLAEAAMDGPNG